MTTEAYNQLESASNETFPAIAESHGFSVEGPSDRGAFLIKDGEQAWLFGVLRIVPISNSVKALRRFACKSEWSELNIQVMRGGVQ